MYGLETTPAESPVRDCRFLSQTRRLADARSSTAGCRPFRERREHPGRRPLGQESDGPSRLLAGPPTASKGGPRTCAHSRSEASGRSRRPRCSHPSLTQAGAATIEADALPGRAPVPRPDLIAAEIVIASEADADPRGDPAQLPTGAGDPLPDQGRCAPGCAARPAGRAIRDQQGFARDATDGGGAGRC
jgi:hypothetical protein